MSKTSIIMKNRVWSNIFIICVYITFIAGCSSNHNWQIREYVLTGPDSISVAHPDMISPRGICLFTLEDQWKHEYLLFLYPSYTKAEFEYEFTYIPVVDDSTGLLYHPYKIYKGDVYTNKTRKYTPVSVGDTLMITLKISSKYPKYHPDFFQPQRGKGYTVEERLGIIYTCDDLINIRGRLFLKNKSTKE
ncbi:MAG TPA: hypothetical protein PLA08_04655 [Candidatus Cloacimonadota bacterium]|mgnify:CR=1 FL=1|nr:hypothetical protein [Candidatus Cloacimonadota bacterium]